ncbi:MAG: c-type cytochrome [Ignavibacteriaceae bacterium]|nr:c-type cytochrome [Ignavibacteriaceae bacterium]
MELLDKIVLPQSAEHIELLHYVLMLIFFLFIPFISLIFGGTFLSLWYKRKGLKTSDKNYLKFSREIIELTTINKSIGVIIGIFPIITAILVYAQLLHTSKSFTVIYLFLALILIIPALIFIYTYRYSLSFNEILSSVKNIESADDDIQSEFKRFSNSAKKMTAKSGFYGFIFLIAALALFFTGLNLASNPGNWGIGGIITDVFNFNVLLKVGFFIALAFALTGGAILFVFFYWNGGKKFDDEAYKNFVQKKALSITLTASLFIPLFILIDTIGASINNLSTSVFGYTTLVLIVLFVVYNFIYSMMKNADVKYSAHVFFLLIFAASALIVRDQLAMNHATKSHSIVLSAEYDKMLAELKGENKIAEVSGEEIFTIRCASCHKWDQKLVGPAYKDVLPKYEGKEAQLIAFIRNPVKVDPAYPSMPNPGLKPNEADAVAKYLLATYKTK